MKTCTACGEQKPLSDYYLEKGTPRAKCKDCHKATAYKKRLEDRDAFNEERREYTKNNRDKINQAAREFRERHGDRINEQRRQRRAEDPDHRERLNATSKASRDRYPERVAERNARYYEANRERLNAASKADYYAKREHYAALSKVYREANRERRKEAHRIWRSKNRHVIDAYNARRRGQLKAATPIRREDLWDRDGGLCGICGKAIDGPFDVDHIVPLVLGGAHEPYNLQVTHPACNRRKHAKLEGQISLPV